MRILGDYTPETIGGKLAINPVHFITVNWPLLCRLARLEPKPEIVVTEGTDETNMEKSFPVLYFFDTGKVVVKRRDLESDLIAAQMSGAPFTCFLWSHPCTMVRYALRHRGIVPQHELIDIGTARTFGWPMQIIDTRLKTIALPPEHPEYAQKCDNLAIETAVMMYLITRGMNDLDEKRIAAILTTKKSSLDRSAFEFPRKK